MHNTARECARACGNIVLTPPPSPPTPTRVYADNSTQHWAFADVIEALAQATRPLKVTCATMA